MKSYRIRRSYIVAFTCLFMVVGLLTNCGRREAAWTIENPYAGVNWDKDGQYKASLHTHTLSSGGTAEPQEVIDRYRELGYQILAITDHDTREPEEPTWPWEAYDRDPEALGMVAIQGNEISAVHHIGSHFNDYGDAEVGTVDEALAEIGRRGGAALFHHPGRYDYEVAWYADMYRRYDHLLGLEVYNRDDRYSGDRKLWDAILSELLPGRSVSGFASDDMHNLETQIGISWNVVIVSELTSEQVRQALEEGRFYFLFAPQGHDGAAAPVIEKITVDEHSGTIRIKASGHEYVEWVSRDTIVHRGTRLELGDLLDKRKFVRAEIHGPDGITVGTQPFRIGRTKAKESRAAD